MENEREQEINLKSNFDKNQISFGDLVLVYEGRDNIKYILLEPGKIFHNKFGHFKHFND